MIVDEIWNNYDFDHSGTLEEDEMRKFIQDLMPEMSSGFKFCECAFQKIFKEFDDDGSGAVRKSEMTLFIKRILNNKTDDEEE